MIHAARAPEQARPIPRGPAFHRDVLRAGLTSAAVIVALTTWAWSDVLTWQRIFESHGMWAFDAQYQAGHEVVLYGLIALGFLFLLPSGRSWALGYGIAVYSLAYGGLADVLYYWLDGRVIPATLPWLDTGHPLILVHPVTAPGLLVSTLAWLLLWAFVVSLAITRAWHRRRVLLRRPIVPAAAETTPASWPRSVITPEGRHGTDRAPETDTRAAFGHG